MGPPASVPAEVWSTLTLPELIDYHLEHNPTQPWAIFPSATPGAEPEKITYLEFARATQRFARIVCAGGDVPVKRGEIVGILVHTDSLLYVSAVGGLMRGGFTAFPISPRNSKAGIAHLLRKVGARRLLITRASTGALADAVHAELSASDHTLSLEELPAFTNIFPRLAHETAADPFDPIPLPRREAFVRDCLAFMHSSGSTGLPKPIPWTVQFLHRLGMDQAEFRDSSHDFALAGPVFPAFHAMGLFLQFHGPLFTGRPGVHFRPAHPHPPIEASPDVTLATLKAVRSTGIMVVPTFIEMWVHDHAAVEFLMTLKFIILAGGPLAQEVGDALIRAGCTIRILYGATEFGCPTRLFIDPAQFTPAREDWMYLALSPHTHARWVAQPGDTSGIAELQLLVHGKFVLALENLPDVQGYGTNDLFAPHPTVPGLWKLIGRADDILVLANGEKVVPGPTEGALLAQGVVTGAILFGRERNQAGVLVEPADVFAFDPTDASDLAAFRNKLWPALDNANRLQPAFARIFKEMVLVTRRDAPLPRVGKGTINRPAALAAYKADIDALYETVENSVKGGNVPPPETWTEAHIMRWLLDLTSAVQNGTSIDINADLFAQGFDSLSATLLRNGMIGAIRMATDAAVRAIVDDIGNGFVYAHPSVQRMSAGLITLLTRGNPGHEGGNRNEMPMTALSAVQAMIETYSQNMPELEAAMQEPSASRCVILITGSTGGLGSHILATLLKDERVTKVYALNRRFKIDSLSRQRRAFEDRGLDIGLLASPQLVFLDSDASEELLGLSADVYEEVRNEVTIIIHNAWRIDFNLGLAAFESNIRATRRLLDLALTSKHAYVSRVLFTSSVSVAHAWPSNNGPYPEEPQADPRWTLGSGYGEGKYVSERLLYAASQKGLQTTSFRIDQIAGSATTGAWSLKDWVPLLLKSSVALKCLPDTNHLVTWMPADSVSQSIIDIALGDPAPDLAVNLQHPRPVSWKKIMHGFSLALQDTEVTQEPLPLIDMQTWVHRITAAADNADADVLRRIPAITLLNFFASLVARDGVHRLPTIASTSTEAAAIPKLAIEKAHAASGAFREMPALSEQHAARWVGYWKTKGLFHDFLSGLV